LRDSLLFVLELNHLPVQTNLFSLPVRQVDTREQLQNITQLRVVNYRYDDQFANVAGLSLDQRSDTGVLAQELHRVLPDAVLETGDVLLPTGETIPNLLVVNKVRVKLPLRHSYVEHSVSVSIQQECY